ncbi:MAG TPA: hypothetical protein VGZ73_20475 [Bryobacteraceae bacterium]|jgi:hypothetical protein|nr:hypothetical protein [Bryobacteraceae bacterium]
MAATITASQYKERYENVWVPMDDGRSVTVSVNKYRLNNSAFHNPAYGEAFVRTLARRGIDMDLRIDTLGGTHRVDLRLNQHADMAKKGKQDLVLSTPGLGKNDRRFDTRITDWTKLAKYAFAGKGSPEASQIVLQLAVHWGLTTNPQEYADAALGTDCNGFVGNYIWHVLRGNEWYKIGVANNELGPDSPIKSGFYDHYKKNLVRRWEDLDNNRMYIMMRTDDDGNVINQGSGENVAHIVITEPGGRQDRPDSGLNPFAVTAVESTAGAVLPGLSESYYTCKGMLVPLVFKIYREAMKAGHRDKNFMIAAVT